MIGIGMVGMSDDEKRAAIARLIGPNFREDCARWAAEREARIATRAVRLALQTWRPVSHFLRRAA